MLVFLIIPIVSLAVLE
uniref:Uncharacterized protein n=1 Tax=Arundo donax TaxID=35708 RepID=A0A0A9FUJ9_ARUDO